MCGFTTRRAGRGSALASLVEEADRHSGPMPVPTLLLRASTLVNSTEEVKARFPNIEVQEIEGAHFLQLERPHEVNDAIRNFIRGVPMDSHAESPGKSHADPPQDLPKGPPREPDND